MRILFALMSLACVACETTRGHDDADLQRQMVGQWQYDRDEDGCAMHAYVAYRGDGTLTATYESCDMISDGFGRFTYGWYVADGHLCFVEIEEQYKDQVKRPKQYRKAFIEKAKRGFVEEDCPWRVGRMTAKTMEILPRHPESKPFKMRRENWY